MSDNPYIENEYPFNETHVYSPNLSIKSPPPPSSSSKNVQKHSKFFPSNQVQKKQPPPHLQYFYGSDENLHKISDYEKNNLAHMPKPR
jgi:hypothetical protein